MKAIPCVGYCRGRIGMSIIAGVRLRYHHVWCHCKSPPSDVPVKPRVSVVIVSYNCEEALRRCVQALEASRGREQMEILTVDAGSEDGSPRIDSEFPAVTVMRLPRNFGKTRARNIGVRTAQADLLLFLDPHVEVDPGTVLGLADLLD